MNGNNDLDMVKDFGDRILNAADKKGHKERTISSGIGGGVGAVLGSFMGPLGAVAGAALGATIGNIISSDD